MSVQASALDRRAVKVDFAWPWGLWGVVSVGLAYGLVYAAMRLAISDTLPLDDVTANVLAQTLEPGYVAKQSPLYEWLLWSVQRFTGPTLVSFLLIKYALLTATFAFLYLAATRIFTDRRWATISALSPLLLYQIGWNLHEGVTHTMVLTCAVAASLWSFMRLAERGALGDYALFGVIAGLGLLGKYGFAGFLLITFVCASLQPVLRARLFDWRVVVSLAMAAAVTAPFVYWLIAERHDLAAVYNNTVAPMASDRLRATAIGLARAVWAPIGFLFPLIIILPIVFPRMLRVAGTALGRSVRPGDWDQAKPDWRLFLLHVTLGGFVLLFLGTVFTGATQYLERYMHPFFLLTPLWLLALVERTGNAERKVLVLAAILAAVTATVVPVRALNLLRSNGAQCHKCRLAVPYDGLAALLAAQGVGSGTIIASNRHDAGNLRRLFPEARIVSLNYPNYGPKVRPRDLRSKAAVVWRGAEGEGLPRRARQAIGGIGGEAVTAPQEVHVSWTPLGLSPAERDWTWMVMIVEPSGAPQRSASRN